MAKVICERERIGSSTMGSGYGKGKRNELRYRNAEDAEEPLDSLPRYESMKAGKLRMWTKSLNENLAPLRKFLEKQVGRPWDKVQSEIIRTCGNETAVQRHVMQHVRQYVHTLMIEIDGVVHERVHRRFWGEKNGKVLPLRESSVDLYVHPRTKLLCRNKWLARRRQDAKKRRAVREEARSADARLIDGRRYVKRGGLWFVAWAEKEEQLVGSAWVERDVDRYRIVPTRQLRQLGLVNDAAA